MKRYTGRKGRVYLLEDEPFAKGGEGFVHSISGNPDQVAKLYRPDKKFKTEADRQELREKVETMYSMKLRTTIDGILRVAWVEDVLYDNGVFVGFVMPRVKLPYKIYHIMRDDRKKIFPDYTWKYSVQYAYNLSWVVWYLHMNGIIIGDLNTNNIAVGEKGEVVLIDCDSFDILNPKTKKRYKCTVGLQEFLAPEIQMMGKIANADFSKESDNFSLAIHIFRLLMDNADPFGAKVVGRNVNSKTDVSANVAIINGECPHFRQIPNKEVPPYAPKLDLLPPDVAAAFTRTFNYTQLTAIKNIKNRTSAEEWNRLLLKCAQAEPNPNLKRCATVASHVYPIHHAACPFCQREAAAAAARRVRRVTATKK